MNYFDIFIIFVSWGTGGKPRPVLLFVNDNNTYDVYKITTKYDNKSDYIKKQCFPIKHWKESGLDKPSYIDTNTLYNIPIDALVNKKLIGTLTYSDKIDFLNFILTKNK